MEDQKPITETIGDEKKIKEYLNCLTKYRLRDGTEGNMTLEQVNNGISSKMPYYSNIKDNLISKAKQADLAELKSIGEFTSNEEMIRKAVDYLSAINDSLGSMARGVLAGCEAHIKVDIRKDSDPINYSSASTTYDGSRYVTELQVKKDIGGVIAIAQELVNTALFVEHKKQSTKEDERHDNFAEDTAKTFVGLMLVQYVGEKENMTPEQIDKLQSGVLNDLTDNIATLEEDEILIREILEAHPDLSKKNPEAMTPDDYKKVMDIIKESPKIDKDKIEDRMEDIAENGESAQYLSNEITADLTATLLENQVITSENPQVAMEKTTEQIIGAAIAGNSISEATGMSKETVVETCSTQIDSIMNPEPQVPFATAIDRAQELENENEMVMVRKYNPNTIKK